MRASKYEFAQEWPVAVAPKCSKYLGGGVAVGVCVGEAVGVAVGVGNGVGGGVGVTNNPVAGSWTRSDSGPVANSSGVGVGVNTNCSTKGVGVEVGEGVGLAETSPVLRDGVGVGLALTGVRPAAGLSSVGDGL